MNLSRAWQERPPNWLNQSVVNESDLRDEMFRFLKALNYDCISEYDSVTGRTDLFIRGGAGTSALRFEFKVWGRNDYKDIPSKPIKYMLDDERVGVVVMINASKRKSIGMDYRRQVEDSSTSVSHLVDLPFETDLLPDHFVSVHVHPSGQTVEIMHIVFDKYPAMQQLLQELS